HAPTGAYSQAGEEQGEGSCQRPLIPLDGDLLAPGGEVMLEHGCEPCLVNGLESLAFGAERGVYAAGGGGDGLQGGLVEMGFDEVAGIVFQEPVAAGQGNE